MTKKVFSGLLISLALIIFIIAASVSFAASLPTMPPSGYGDGGKYPAGSVASVSYYSPSQGKNDTMYVYTPPGYTSSQKYPVVYGYPGIGASADTIFAGWCVNASTIADNLIGQGTIQPVIIVAIDDNAGDVQQDTLNVIIPYIDSHYSTYADADHRGLYGYSWGGGYTFNIGCGNLDIFHHLSPSSAAPNKASDDQLFPNGGAEAKQKLKTLLISCGESDWMGLYPSSLNCHNYCNTNGIPNYWLSVAGGNHDAGVWAPAMWNFLQLAFPVNQSTTPTPTPTPTPTGSYVRFRNAATGLYIDGMGSTSNGANACQWGDSNSTNQQWILVSSGGYVMIQNRATGLYLDGMGRTGNGAICGQWGSSGSANQQWTEEASGSNVRFKNRATGLYLDGMGSTGNGSNLCQWSDSGSANQQWQIQ